MLSNIINNKKYAPKIMFFNEKNARKIQMIFDVENYLIDFEIQILGNF